MLYDDTIVAIATPPGEGGIGIVRLSGAGALEILQRMVLPVRPGAWRPFRMRYGYVVNPDGARIDEVLAVFMRGPHSYTAEDVAEISCHGGPLVLSRVLMVALGHGARAAEPGEFTLRAFVNGRIDLSQAEATLDVIQAKTDTALALAQNQLGGWLAGELRRVRELLLVPLAYCTALVDFPEDEVEPQPVAAPLQAAHAQLEQLLIGADQGIVYRQGAHVALVGRPNAGKSSLLNALLRTDRAIVTPIPGTTRDTLEETANLNGVPVVLVDTAGITETTDPVEQLGVMRSRAALSAADLVLLVRDGSVPSPPEDAHIAAAVAGKPTILVLNKIDLLASEQVSEGMELGSELPTLLISALTGAGIPALAATIARQLLGGTPQSSERLVSNPRHRDALARACSHVEDALVGYGAGIPPDLLAVDLTAALTVIGEITGDSVQDDLLATIFSTFCIGK